MKLAEALVERKAAQTKISELNERLHRVIFVQEGEQPAEQPIALLHYGYRWRIRCDVLNIYIPYS